MPGIVLPTLKLELITLPAVIVHAGNAIMLVGVLEIVKHASVGLKPPPVTVTGVLNGPVVGDNAICGPVTVKTAVPKSPLLPVTVTTYVPGVASSATVKLVEVNVPVLVIVHEGKPIMFAGVLEIVVHVSTVLKPLPVIVTAVPAGPELGASVMAGEVVVTTNFAEAVSPVLPVTVTVYVPGVAASATVKLVELNVPVLVIVHEGKPIMFVGVLEIVVHVSAGLKPLPVMVTPVPA